MINDIVFQQNYAKKVDEHIQKVANQSYMAGRQQGWNDMIFVLNSLQQDNIELSQANIIAGLQSLIYNQEQNQKEENAEKAEDSKPKVKTGLSLVK